MAKKGQSEDKAPAKQPSKSPKKVDGNNPADEARNAAIAALEQEIAADEERYDKLVEEVDTLAASIAEKEDRLKVMIEEDARLDDKEAEEEQRIAEEAARKAADAAQRAAAKRERVQTSRPGPPTLRPKGITRRQAFIGAAIAAAVSIGTTAFVLSPVGEHESGAGWLADKLNRGGDTPEHEGSAVDHEGSSDESQAESTRITARERLSNIVQGLQEERERERQEREAAEQLDPIPE